jgi:hypothetical protein
VYFHLLEKGLKPRLVGEIDPSEITPAVFVVHDMNVDMGDNISPYFFDIR